MQIAPAVERLHFEKMDLSDFSSVEALFQNNGFDAIMHFAASIVVSESVENPLKYYMNNTVNTVHLVSKCVKYGVNRFIFSSTAAVYGEPSEIPVKESATLEPINPYGMSKLMSERVIQDVAVANPAFKYVIFRYFNVAGADVKNRIGECHEPETHLIPLIVKTALNKRNKITVFGTDYDTHDGTCIRDYIHVEDLAQAHITGLNYLATDTANEVFNCGYGHGYSVKEVIDAVKRVSKSDFDVEQASSRAGDPAVLVADNMKIMDVLQWQPRYDNLEMICSTALAWEMSFPV
jgi:UDP-glucose 4-epimerase